MLAGHYHEPPPQSIRFNARQRRIDLRRQRRQVDHEADLWCVAIARHRHHFVRSPQEVARAALGAERRDLIYVHLPGDYSFPKGRTYRVLIVPQGKDAGSVSVSHPCLRKHDGPALTTHWLPQRAPPALVPHARARPAPACARSALPASACACRPQLSLNRAPLTTVCRRFSRPLMSQVAGVLERERAYRLS